MNLKNENATLNGKIDTQDQMIQSYNSNSKEMEIEIDQLTDSKDAVKKSNNELNAKVQELEQEVFDSKTIQLNLMENLKASRDELDQMRIVYQ